MKTIGIFSKLGMPGGSENRVLQLANSFSKKLATYIFAQEGFSGKLKKRLDTRVILRENTVHTKRFIYELQGVDALLVVNSDSYSFCKPSFWNGTQGKHHKNCIDISQIPNIVFLFNYVVGPGQWLYDLHKINPNIKIMVTSKWFQKNLEKEKKFDKLRTLNLPIKVIESPVSSDFALPKKPSRTHEKSKVIRINRHSMSFAYKHDQMNLQVIDKLSAKYGDKISFKWMGVPSQVRDINSDNKKQKVSYRSILEKCPQMQIVETYSMDVPDLLQETDILFFYISRYRKEPWPRTIAEGMMGGCCCVTNDAYGMAEQIDHGRTGYLFDSTDPDQAFDLLCNLIDNPEKILIMGNAAQKYAEGNFLDDRIIEKTLAFIEQ